MRAITLLAFFGLTGMLSPVAAAVPQDQEPPGNLGIWLFLAFCSLIVVAQLLTLVFRKLPEEEDGKSVAQSSESTPGGELLTKEAKQ